MTIASSLKCMKFAFNFDLFSQERVPFSEAHFPNHAKIDSLIPSLPVFLPSFTNSYPQLSHF